MNQPTQRQPESIPPKEQVLEGFLAGIDKAPLSKSDEKWLMDSYNSLITTANIIKDYSDEKLQESLTNLSGKIATLKEKRSEQVQAEYIPQYQIRLLAILREMIYRQSIALDPEKPILARPRQCLAILASLQNKENLVNEVKTGQGKTLIFALLAAVTATTGEPVDVLTSNSHLALEGYEFFHDYVTPLSGLTVGLVTRDNEAELATRQQPYKAHICYSAVDNIVYDSLSETYNSTPLRTGRKYANLLLDEEDFQLLDQLNEYKLSMASLRESDLAWMYHQLNRFYDAHPNMNRDNLAEYADPLRQWLLKSHPNHAAEINLWPDDQLTEWLESAITAATLRQDVDYFIRENPNYSTDEKTAYMAAPVALTTSGEINNSSRWGAGVHQLLHDRLATSDPQKRYFPIEDEGASLPSMTMPDFVRLYKRMIGMTGTIGNELERMERAQRFGARFLFVPAEHQRITHPTITTPSPKDDLALAQKLHFNAIYEDAIQTKASGQPILIAFDSIQKTLAFKQYLAERGHNDIGLLNATGTLEDAQTIIKKGGEAGSITLTTIFGGRGVDIKPTPEALAAGGLHVIRCFVARSPRVDEQLIGRAGRQGQVGSTRLIIPASELGHQAALPPDEADKLVSELQKRYVEEDFFKRLQRDVENQIRQPYYDEFFAFVRAFQKKAELSYVKAVIPPNMDLGVVHSAGTTLANTLGFVANLSRGDVFNAVNAANGAAESVFNIISRLRRRHEQRGQFSTDEIKENTYAIFNLLAQAASKEWHLFDNQARRIIKQAFEEAFALHPDNLEQAFATMQQLTDERLAQPWQQARARIWDALVEQTTNLRQNGLKIDIPDHMDILQSAALERQAISDKNIIEATEGRVASIWKILESAVSPKSSQEKLEAITETLDKQRSKREI